MKSDPAVAKETIAWYASFVQQRVVLCCGSE